uniref:Dehydrogenase/reductase SDR family member 11 n=1 Tax=Timema poppense TaxID=170557 RepID=A0A7R9DAC5_TIMPO|nr:unnamed protein product [Timema poppensis]
MRERGVDDGHIIHINSIAGHSILNLPLHFYTASKHAVTVLTEGLRRELVALNSHIRVTSVNPGNVETEFVDAMGTMGETNSAAYYKENPFLASRDISDAVIYTLSTPPHVQIHDITIKPIGEKF